MPVCFTSTLPFQTNLNFASQTSMADKKIKNELDNDYRLVGIATSLKEYKLCHHLNQLLGCDLRKLDALEFEPKDRSRKIQFSVFKAGDENDKNTFVVFTNKNLGEFLLPEVGNFDYIIQVLGKFADEELQLVVENIKQFPEVVMSTEIPVKKIKSRERLVYEEEKHSPRLLQAKKTNNA
ncbi:MAG: IPExxxVDY family protein [Bacteroidota bacterium]|nr:IPExxxVDY family protein [Bacteroidota bacterium]